MISLGYRHRQQMKKGEQDNKRKISQPTKSPKPPVAPTISGGADASAEAKEKQQVAIAPPASKRRGSIKKSIKWDKLEKIQNDIPLLRQLVNLMIPRALYITCRKHILIISFLFLRWAATRTGSEYDQPNERDEHGGGTRGGTAAASRQLQQFSVASRQSKALISTAPSQSERKRNAQRGRQDFTHPTKSEWKSRSYGLEEKDSRISRLLKWSATQRRTCTYCVWKALTNYSRNTQLMLVDIY